MTKKGIYLTSLISLLIIVGGFLFGNFIFNKNKTPKAILGEMTPSISSGKDHGQEFNKKFVLDTKGLIKNSNYHNAKKELQINDQKILVQVIRDNKVSALQPEITTVSGQNGVFEIGIDGTSQYMPGRYTLKVDLTTASGAQTLTQDFLWGVLAINVRRSYEQTNHETQIGMSVLDNAGRTQCAAEVELAVTDPSGRKVRFKTSDGTIAIDPDCVDRGVTNNPDYAALYTTGNEGEYTMEMTATIADGTRSLTDTFQVKDDVPFDIERTAFPTRIYPVPEYPVELTIKASESYQGKITETVPESFDISAVSDNSDVKPAGKDTQQIVWEVDWLAGETHTLGYTIKFPMITPEWYLIGPLEIGKFSEARQWQIASDAYACTLALSANANWTTAAWGTCGTSGYPGKSNTGDTASVTPSGTGTYILTMNSQLSYSIASLALNAGGRIDSIAIGAYNLNVTDSPGTVTVTAPAANYTHTISTTSGTLTASGLVTISSGSTSARIGLLTTSTGNIYANAGVTFGGAVVLAQQLTTTSTGKIYLTGNLSYNGTVTMAASSTFTMNGSGTISNGGTTAYTFDNFTIAAGTTTLNAAMTVAGNWTNNSGTTALTGDYVVTFSGASKTIGGTYLTPFYGLAFSTGASAQLNTNTTVGAGNLTIGSATGGTATSLTHNTSIDLTITGTVTVNQPTTAAVIYAWNINAGTATVSDTVTVVGTNNTASYINKIVLTTGTLDMNGSTSLSFDAATTVANHVIVTSGGAANIFIAGAITNPNNATSTPGTTSTWTFDGTSAQTIPIDSASGTYWGACTTQCYAKLTILNTAGATLGNTVSTGDISDNVTVGDDSAAAILNNGGFAMAGASGKTFLVNNNAFFNMTDTSTYPTGFSTFTYDATSTVNYMQTSGLTITNATYGNLGLMPGGATPLVLPGTLSTIAGDLTIGDSTNEGATAVANDPTITVTGNVTIAANATFVASDLNTMTVTGNWLTTGTLTSTDSTIAFNKGSGTQTLDSGGVGAGHLFNNLTHSGAGTLQLTTNAINIDGIFTNSAGIFDANDLNMTIADDFLGSGGTFSADVAPGATTQTVTFDSTAEATVSGSNTFRNLTMNTTTDGAKTIKFTAATTQTINNTWTLDGAVGKVLILRSTTDTSAWKFVIPADINPTGDYIDVKDSQNTTNAYRITAGADYVDSGNNVPGWLFPSANTPPTNDSLTFTNPYSSNIAISDDTTEWNFRTLVTDTDGPTNIDYVELRFANSADSSQPYDSLKLRWTESTDTFSEQADTQNAITLTSTNANSNAVGNQWTLDFKIKIDSDFLAKDTQYAAELYSLDDAAASDNDNYANKYQVTLLSLSLDVDNASLSFGSLLPGSIVTGTTVTTVTTNYPNGYSLGASDAVVGTNSTLLHTDTTTRIADYAGTIAVPTVWAGTGLGITVWAASTAPEAKWCADVCSAEVDPDNKYAGVPETVTTIHAKTGSPTSGDTTSVGYKMVVPNTQKTGDYSGDITYTATGVLL